MMGSLVKSLVFFVLAIQLVKAQIQVANPFSDIHPDCNHFYNKTDGTILKTPNFDSGDYPANKVCGWVIESPEEAAGITIKFEYFSLEATKRCLKYDYVMVYKQGNGQNVWESTGLKDGYCGRQDPITITETTKRMLIKFVSDSSRNAPGFNATFNIQITQSAPKIICLARRGDATCNRTIFIEEFDTFLVQCTAEAIPPATFKWERRFNLTHWQEIRPEIVKNVFPNGSIHMHEIRMIDEGDFRCNAKNKHGNRSEMFKLKVAEKCQCPKYISTSWYDYPPYTKYNAGTDEFHNPKFKGIFYVILQDMINDVCGNCTKGHGVSQLVWDDAKNRKKSLNNVKDEIEDDTADIYFPIEGGKLDNKYRNIYYFLPTVDSPGIAFMVIGAEEGASAMAIFDSVLEGWPILVLTVVMAILAGIIMWMLDTYWNEEQFPRNFAEGIIEGFWWAFVTMTTVGYGDIAPVGVPGRLFAIIWILTGLVIIAIFTGVITTSLTVVALSSSLKLYGTKIGAITNTAEYRMGVIKNAKMSNYSTFDQLKIQMDARSIDGCLIDSYVAAYHKDKFGTFRVNNIITSRKAFGLVLGKRLSSQRLYDKFAEYLENNKARIVSTIEGNSDTLSEPSESAAMEASSDLFNPSSKLFTSSMIGSLIIFIVLSVGGLLFEYGYLRPRHRMIEAAKNLEMVESDEVKEMARRAKLLKEMLLKEVQGFYETWTDRLSNLTKKHKAEQKKLLTNGPSRPPKPKVQVYPQVEEAIELESPDGVDRESTPVMSMNDVKSPAKSSMSLKSNETSRSTKSLISDDPESPLPPADDHQHPDDLPAEEPLHDDPPAEEPLHDDPPAEEPLADDPPQEDLPAEDLLADDSLADDPRTNEQPEDSPKPDGVQETQNL